MKVLITGSKGQLGRTLIQLRPPGIKIFPMDRSNFDLSDISSCRETIRKIKPDWIINCGAFTNVDLAEKKKELVMKVNCLAPLAFAEEIKRLGGKFLQISTDYVFDGLSRNKPYSTSDERSPISVYGESKAQAEIDIEKTLGNTNKGIILRTSWLFGPVGKNFLITILNLNLKQKRIKVVYDQIGCLTSTFSLAEVCWIIVTLKNHSKIFDANKSGILHWHDHGQTSWYEIAKEINNIGKEIGLINQKSEIIPIKTSEYKSLARRPLYSVLDSSSTKEILNYSGEHWNSTLKKIMQKIPQK